MSDDNENIHKLSERATVNNMNIQTVFRLLERTRAELQNAQNRIAQLEQHVALMDVQVQQIHQNPFLGAGGVIGSTGPR